jgi:dihydroorotate dehydrogenase electron transfer subunit
VRQERARIISNQAAGEETFVLRLHSEYLASEVKAGQFFHVRVHDGMDPLLRRPLSLHRRSRDDGWFEVLYKIKGRGTRMLSSRQPGEELDVIGPLGKGFPAPPDVFYLVAGGMGVAPFGAVVEDARGDGVGRKAVVLIGARTKNALLCVEEFRRLGADVQVATEDGSDGFEGLVSEMLLNLPEPDAVFCCGPSGMTKSIVRYALDRGVVCYASVEERMGCGIGMCRGCAVPIVDGKDIVYRRVCKDGPVFSAQELACWAESSGPAEDMAQVRRESADAE